MIVFDSSLKGILWTSYAIIGWIGIIRIMVSELELNLPKEESVRNWLTKDWIRIDKFFWSGLIKFRWPWCCSYCYKIQVFCVTFTFLWAKFKINFRQTGFFSFQVTFPWAYRWHAELRRWIKSIGSLLC